MVARHRGRESRGCEVKLRVDHGGGYDLVDTDGTLDFDGGSLIVWRDNTRAHLVAAYSPTGWQAASWEVDS